MLTDLKSRLKSLFRRDAVENDLDAELGFHFDEHVAKLEKSGLSHQDALRRARLESALPTLSRKSIATPAASARSNIGAGPRLRPAHPPQITRLRHHRDPDARTRHRRQRRRLRVFIEAWIIKPLPYPQAAELMSTADP